MHSQINSTALNEHQFGLVSDLNSNFKSSYYHRLYADFLFNSMTTMRGNRPVLPAGLGTESLHRRFSLRERGERRTHAPASAAEQPSALLRTATLTAASQLQLCDMSSSGARRPSVSSTTSTGDSGLGSGLGGRGGLQQYRSRHDYLYAMTEDLADWLNFLYDRDITVETFFDELANGALLCGHACQLQMAAEEFFSQGQQQQQPKQQKLQQLQLPKAAPRYRPDAQPGSFHARDNVAQFIAWCRSLGLPDCLLFETEDLVARKNTRHVILCLLEVARAGAAFGVEVPELVRFEREIDEQELSCSSSTSSSSSAASNDSGLTSTPAASPAAPVAKPATAKPPAKQGSAARRGSEAAATAAAAPAAALPAFKRKKTRWQCDLKSLDELVRELINECTCEQTFPMKRLDEGKYLFGDTQMLIFVRVLRNHVMVRVGGGWDSLEHLLLKHDPCRLGGNSSRSGVPINHQEERQRRMQQQQQQQQTENTSAPPANGPPTTSGTREEDQKKEDKFLRPSQPAPKKAPSQQQQQQKRQPMQQQKSPMPAAMDAHRRSSLQPRRPSSPASSPLTSRRQQPQQQRPATPGASATSQRLSSKK